MERLRADSIILSPDKLVNLGKNNLNSICQTILTTIAVLLIVIFFPASLLISIKVIKEYERAVVFRLGRLLSSNPQGPGILFVIPCIDDVNKVDLRTVSFDIPPQEILSKDSVTVTVDAVVYFRVSNPVISITNVADAFYSTKLLAQTTLRNVLGTNTLGEMLGDRDQMSQVIHEILDDATNPWGVKVERVEVKDIRLPPELMRTMAAEAEAAREARAMFVTCEGEQISSKHLKEAAQELKRCPVAFHLRYLQELSTISSQQNHTIVLPIPADIIKFFLPVKTPPPTVV